MILYLLTWMASHVIIGSTYIGHELYIKISLRQKVVCISFHEKEHDILYPYR